MRNDDLRWMRRADQLGRVFWDRWVQPGGGRIKRAPLRVYALALRLHRWCWVRGLEV